MGLCDLICSTRYTDLKVKLANSTEAELKSLQSSLRSSKDDTAIELQRNVFKKYILAFHSFTLLILTQLCRIRPYVQRNFSPRE